MAVRSNAYMLIFRESTPERYAAMDREQLRYNLDRWNGWVDEMAASGRVQHAHPLETAGRVVSARRVTTIDGPFTEAKELVGGYVLLNAADMDEATRIAERCPLLEYGMTVEVRPVAGACHLAHALGRDTMREPASA